MEIVKFDLSDEERQADQKFVAKTIKNEAAAIYHLNELYSFMESRFQPWEEKHESIQKAKDRFLEVGRSLKRLEATANAIKIKTLQFWPELPGFVTEPSFGSAKREGCLVTYSGPEYLSEDVFRFLKGLSLRIVAIATETGKLTRAEAEEQALLVGFEHRKKHYELPKGQRVTGKNNPYSSPKAMAEMNKHFRELWPDAPAEIELMTKDAFDGRFKRDHPQYFPNHKK